MGQLKNRFPPYVKEAWTWWWECLRCGENTCDALHHIISPTSQHYIAGNHNRSAYNSCPICNEKCHLGQEDWLGKNEPMLLRKSKKALDYLDFKPRKNDIDFLRIYADLYKIDKDKDDFWEAG